jgi:glycosyltransferase involved in cell wall biosynthesis
VGVAFIEDTALDAAALERGGALDLIVAGSTWNEQVLRDAGLPAVTTVLQGIDPSVFHPAPRRGLFPGRFVVFSGGKLEFRKGQDIVVATFREFVRRHPDAVLMVAWHNAWPSLISDLELAGHVHGLPGVADGQLDIVGWLAANGIPPHHVIDVGRQPNALMGQVVREADVALFTNRAEGGTNLVAMECIAAGVPAVLSDNTGHRDLIGRESCAVLGRQGPVPRPTRYFTGTDGWGESSVDEALALLERAYTDTAWRHDLATRGAAALGRLTWRHQVDRLLDVLEPLR